MERSRLDRYIFYTINSMNVLIVECKNVYIFLFFYISFDQLQ